MEIYHLSNNPLKTKAFWSSFVSDFLSAALIGKNLFISDFKSTYREAFLGVAWAIIPSLFLIASYILAENAQIVSTNNSSDVPTFVFLIVGLLSWQNFFDAIQAPLLTLQKSKKYFLKINVPIETYVFSKLFEVLFFSFIRHIIILLVISLFYTLPGMQYIFASFAYALILILFGSALGLLIAPLGILIQDFTKIFSYILSFILFCTPVFYKSVSEGILKQLNTYNPISAPLSQVRSSLIFPNELLWTPSIGILVATLIFFTLGSILLKLAKPMIYERMGI